jgi:hypothetical protein
MKKKIQVWETVETVSILAGDTDGTYRIIWHRIEGPEEEFLVTPAEDESVEEAVEQDLKNRLGP